MITMNLLMQVIIVWQMAAMQLFIMCLKPSMAAIENTTEMAAKQNLGGGRKAGRDPIRTAT